jgi:hypothetical protein
MNATNLLRGFGLGLLLVKASHAAAPVEIVFQSTQLSTEAQLTSAFGSENSYQRTGRSTPEIGQVQVSSVAEAVLAGFSEAAGSEFSLLPDLASSSPQLELSAQLTAKSALPNELSPTNIVSYASGSVSASLTLQLASPMRLTIKLNSGLTGSFRGQSYFSLRGNGGSPMASLSTDFSHPATNQIVTTVGTGTYSLSFDISASAYGRIDIDAAGWFIDQPTGTNTVNLLLEFEPLADETGLQPRFSIRAGEAGQLVLDITGLTPGGQYYLERSVSLAPGDWSYWTSFQAASSTVSTTDTYSQNAGAIFYRLKSFP